MRKVILALILGITGYSAPVAGQVSGAMELTLSRDGTKWRVEVKFEGDERRPSDAVRDFKIRESEIEFTTKMLEAELRFSGKVADGNLNGTIDAFQSGARIGTGTWNLARSAPTSTSGLEGRWVGSFTLQPGNLPQALPPAVDQGFNTNVARPAYVARHPKVLFDEAHNNSDTSTGRYKPFVDLITSDGYLVVSNKEKFSTSKLAGFEMLIIANASGPQEDRASSAFTKQECDAVRKWVDGGGVLLLITDHSPFSNAAGGLASVFGVELTNGHTIDAFHHNSEADDPTELVFARDDGLVGDHPITGGRDASERINRVMTFTGTSIKGPQGSVAFLKLADTAMDVMPPANKTPAPDAPQSEHTQVSAAGRAQGVALSLGKGRVVMLGEAAMLTAQVASRGFRFGMNLPGIDNRQLALNIMHWLSGLLN